MIVDVHSDEERQHVHGYVRKHVKHKATPPFFLAYASGKGSSIDMIISKNFGRANDMQKFFDRLLELLKRDERFFADDGNFLRNAVFEAAMNADEKLLRLLLSEKNIADNFFKDVAGFKVFDKIKFAWTINNRQFLPDSYTRFKNKIGLVDEHDNLISAQDKIALVFPYKDCVLEGGQTADDQKRTEIFYNELLARDDVDRLLKPKVFTNAVRHSKDAAQVAETFSDNDNLIIKGNNLLALASLKKIFAAKVKCIYIDPPYNTGKDSFGYNDRFNHSTWLVFMKNRLEKYILKYLYHSWHVKDLTSKRREGRYRD